MKRKYNRCEECKEFHWNDNNCPPEYLVYHEDLGDEYAKIRANSFEQAGEKYAIDYNDDGDLNDSYIDIKIVFKDESKVFRIFAHPSIEYDVNEIE